jgi:hypothetical protein
MGHGNRDSRRNVFNELKLLQFLSQYIFSFLVFVVNNGDEFLINSELHGKNAGHASSLLLPKANLDIYRKGVHY